MPPWYAFEEITNMQWLLSNFSSDRTVLILCYPNRRAFQLSYAAVEDYWFLLLFDAHVGYINRLHPFFSGDKLSQGQRNYSMFLFFVFPRLKWKALSGVSSRWINKLQLVCFLGQTVISTYLRGTSHYGTLPENKIYSKDWFVFCNVGVRWLGTMTLAGNTTEDFMLTSIKILLHLLCHM